MIKRRRLLQLSSLLAAGAVMPKVYAASQYNGRLLITLQASGGWDVSSFCDPKVNVPGEPEITHWSNSGEVQTAGNIRYAPYGNNQAFFDKYYNDTLIINGVDAQTNAHSVGELHNWSGRNASGYPTLSGLFAASVAPDIPMSYLSFGGFNATGGIIRSTRFEGAGRSLLSTVLRPNQAPFETIEQPFHKKAQMSLIRAAQQAHLQDIIADDTQLPLKRLNATAYRDSLQRKDDLFAFADIIPEESNFPPNVNLGTLAGESNLQKQAMFALLAFKSGTACSADLVQFGFDSHADHDSHHEPLMAHITDSLDYLWTYAETLGIADRLTVVVASDFARTPFYNGFDGKDHWPIGSVMVMEKNASWGNRVVGETDESQNAHRINPSTLLRDDSAGTIIYPKHVHQALRSYLGIANAANSQLFPLNTTETFNFFS